MHRPRSTMSSDALCCRTHSFSIHQFRNPRIGPAQSRVADTRYGGRRRAALVRRDVTIALSGRQCAHFPATPASPFGGYALPGLQPRRLGQGAFRKLILDAYGRRCAVSGEHAVPVIQASHIKPFADVEQHEITNGLALRSDIHILFDQGYVSVTPDYQFRGERAAPRGFR